MKCPGQDTQYWKKDAIYEEHCPECSAVIEFFKDDTSRRCSGCGKKMVNPKMDFGCAAYCQYAEQCIGTLPEEFIKNREDLLKDRVAVEVKRYFKTDFKRIGHAVKVARCAEAIGKKEQGDLSVVLAAAYLHDTGLKKVDADDNTGGKQDHEKQSAVIARKILEKLNANEQLIEQVCTIINHHHHPTEEDDLNFKILFDADLIVNLEEGEKEGTMEKAEIKTAIDLKCLTAAGREEAEKRFF